MRWGEVWVPEERITAAEAFAMHTTTAAYVGFEENDKGTLEIGKLADIAVLAEDPFEIPPETDQRSKSRDDLGGRRSQVSGLSLSNRKTWMPDGAGMTRVRSGRGVTLNSELSTHDCWPTLPTLTNGRCASFSDDRLIFLRCL